MWADFYDCFGHKNLAKVTQYDTGGQIIKSDSASILLANIVTLQPWAALYEIWLLWDHHAVRNPQLAHVTDYKEKTAQGGRCVVIS